MVCKTRKKLHFALNTHKVIKYLKMKNKRNALRTKVVEVDKLWLSIPKKAGRKIVTNACHVDFFSCC